VSPEIGVKEDGKYYLFKGIDLRCVLGDLYDEYDDFEIGLSYVGVNCSSSTGTVATRKLLGKKFLISETTIPVTPTFAISSRTPASLTVTITTSDTDISQYLVYYKSTGSYTLQTSTSNVVTIASLSEDIPYSIYVKTKNTGGIYSSDSTIKADEYTTPSNPTIHETTITTTSIGIDFTNILDTDTTNTYSVYWSWSGGSGSILNSTTKYITITGLTAGTEYTIYGTIRDIVSGFTSGNSYSIVKSTPGTAITATPIYTAASTTAVFSSNALTVSGATGDYAYANGSYTVSSSSNWDATNFVSYKAFNASDTYGWLSGAKYNTSGVYTGTVSTVSSTGTIYGEYLQIQLPYSLILSSYMVKNVFLAGYICTSFTLVGSSDGSTWTTIDIQTLTKLSTTDETTSTVSSVLAYNYYRFIVRNGKTDAGAGINRLSLIGTKI
jgi:hypothetical protein